MTISQVSWKVVRVTTSGDSGALRGSQHADARRDAVADVIREMRPDAPRPLLRRVNTELDDLGLDPLTESELLEMLLTEDANEPVRVQFFIKLGSWSTEADLRLPPGSEPTAPETRERRSELYRVLGLPEDSVDDLEKAYPDPSRGNATIITAEQPWAPWYPREGQSTFYWDNYVKVLRNKNFGDPAINELDASTRKIVERLADPSRATPYQSKGLVVGYVQSGKTANFAGTVAKAIDAGYKLVIVLTGTIELLRSQTQKRLDKELVGEENVLGGAATRVRELQSVIAGLDESDPVQKRKLQDLSEQLDGVKSGVDYIAHDDQDWKDGKFSKFGVLPDDAGAPRIVRLTELKDDYKRLRDRLADIDFDSTRADKTKPMFAEENLAHGHVWLAVVKKNASTLKKLRDDLHSMRTKLGDIPALIVDDEADQASVNTKRPKRGVALTKEEKERTAINKHISEILSHMPRCQYLAYTATPFANVFVDPVDSADIFPKDFIVALEPSDEYMGAKAFHDIDGSPEAPTIANSNKQAYYRPLPVDEDGMAEDDGLRSAVDAYVLSGAIKLWRSERLYDPSSLKHHTMMVHEGAKTTSHVDSAERVRSAWQRGNFTGPAGVARLRHLWESDFAHVSEARAAGAPGPTSFDELKKYIPQVVKKVNKGYASDGATNPVVLVNGSKESEYMQPDINFDAQHGVWKILVGGTKLSRGFTVEGLTITVYTRVSVAADTLMQMGRWFGYRKYYRDLVRLYLGSDIQKHRRSIDLYDAFTSIARDEEDFRSELAQFSKLRKDGRPVITPMDVAPLVIQRLPWLKPTGANKMYNARIVEKGTGGKAIDLFALKDPGTSANTHNTALFAEMMKKLDRVGVFATDARTQYSVRYAVLDASTVVEFLRRFEFFDRDVYESQIRFVESRIGLEGSGGINDFVVFFPMLSGPGTVTRRVPGLDEEWFPVLQRNRRLDRNDFSGSSLRQRVAVDALAGRPGAVAAGYGGESVTTLREQGRNRRGALMLTVVADQKRGESNPDALTDPVDPESIAVLPTLAVPFQSAPEGIVAREVINPGLSDEPVVDAAT